MIKNNNEENSTNKYYIGFPLYDKTLENGNKWNIVVENKTQKIYGTGWNYIEKGTEISGYGKTENSWLINYDNEDIIECKENEYTNLMYGTNLAVKDSLILNVDPINMSNSESWGENVKLYGIEEGDGYGWNKTEIKFDGVDDYLEIYNSFDMDEGITFEFYGKGSGNLMMLSKATKGNTNDYLKFRTYFDFKNSLLRCCMANKDSKSDWKVNDTENKHWIKKQLNSFSGGNYITMVVNLKQNTISIYQEEILQGTTVCSDEWLRNGGITDNTIPFVIGMMIGGITYTESYSKMDLYSCRLYNKVLNDDEIKENYDKTVAYHNMLTSERKM